jgi:uncharacterized protein
MFKKIPIFITVLALLCSSFCQITIVTSDPGQIFNGDASIFYRNVTVYAPAVASTDTGYVGIISTITVTIQSNGSGRVFVDTLPLAEVDMQGSARLAVKVASTLVENDENCDVDPNSFDYFFVVRTSSPVIGGPSAGAIMTVATISLLENWEMDNETITTGMINPDGSIGPIGGIPQKIDAAYSAGATHFLIPYGQGTYTEMVTTTEYVNGWLTTVTRPVTRNIADYAMDNYGIVVDEVADINEAVENFTGYRFFFNETEGKITTEDYLKAMKPLASVLLEDADQAYENASIKLDNSSIPNNFPTNYKDDIVDQLKTSKDSLTKSEEAYDNETYYTSTSKSFQSLISSRFVLYACRYWEPGNTTFFQDIFQEVESWYNNAADKAKNAEISGFISLQSVGAAQRRASEAKQYLDEAETMYTSGLNLYSQVLDFLYNLAFVVERSNSIGWWIGIGSYFNETGVLDKDALENLALEYIDEAQQAATYSGIILGEMGAATSSDSSNYLSLAEELLQTARDNLDGGYPAAALFESLEATVRANLAIEIIGAEPKDKIDLASSSASIKIANSRRQGIEPVLAVSYYEYGESLANESDFNSALLYYKYGGMIAGALGFADSTTRSSSRYVGLPQIIRPSSLDWPLIVSITAILAIIAGIGLGLVIGGVATNKKEDFKKLIPKSLYNYSNRPKHPYFSSEDMPRSIKDYYKKNR